MCCRAFLALMESETSINGRSRDLGSGVSTPRSSSDNLQQPRSKLTFSLPQEGPATFDESDLVLECGLDRNRTVPTLRDFTVAIPNQLLLVSLLEHLCFVYECNPQRSMSLFKLLCQKLAGLHLISPIIFSDEFSTVRLQHNQAFTNLLQAASNGLIRQGHATNEDIPAPMSYRAKETLFQRQTSRYLNEFEETEILGKGSYGEVYKVRNKLDRQLYAIKKILMKKITKYDCMKIHFHLMLHIQMQLCERSLQDWILDRNTRPGEGPSLPCPFSLVEPDCTNHVFRQLLEGVHFIHSKGVMHRDLKPRNVFLHGSNYHVRIGDFGLACSDIIAETSDQWPAPTTVTDSKHTSGVGTSLYASPEQLRGSSYNFKSDMYSVGIILLELFQPFRTVMERIKTLTALRECHIPGNFTHRWPVHAKYVKMLTSEIASCRPSADEMLASELFHNSPEVTTFQDNLEQRVVTQEQEIKSLRQKVINQDDEIRNLKEKIKLLSGEGEPS
ncbi:eukaryotic translation initiation factor 2-alpha kinase 1 isoform X3 [Carcharodon carcharias]|uniref:eukaryotic translation initiation factor 2-alpha kinase 1 isoform X3 n=1 Tax=Carcharodon carcharias TaxID=13397 RepID=UPI001B7EFD0B|nr:eukaryotic translation initiation factor 2-alpha kinase 1 isoform X3 [Carcharodon carcharias]